MAFTIDKDGNITLIQGDSGELVINGLPTDKNYSVYFAIQDENRNPIGSEIELDTNNSSSVIFTITGSLTNLLTVNKDDETATYYYGIKLCNKDDFMEDTLLIGNTQIGSLNTITVYPKKVEGI